MLRKIILLIAILALVSMACGFNINLPKVPKPGPEVTEDVNVDAPKTDEVNLTLAFGAGEINLQPGASDLVNGTATYNYSTFKPVVQKDGGDVEVKMSEVDFNAFPPVKDLKNKWDFELGDTLMNLNIEAGAYTGTYEFGGLSLGNLSIHDGAAKVNLSFSEPNQTEMSTFLYETGASDVKMTGLGNANFSLFDFSAGAGDYTLDFSGDLQRDASVKISSGLSNMILIIPEGVDAVVTIDGGASNISAGPNWTQNGNVYTQKGTGPTLVFIIDVGAGNITLTD